MSVESQRTVSALHADGLSAALDELSETGAAALVLHGASVHDEASLMECVARDLDLAGAGVDPPRSWDGLKDAMWSIVGVQDREHVVLLWTGAEAILQSSLADLLVAIELFELVADDVRRRSTGVGSVRFQLVLVGSGAMFPPYGDGQRPQGGRQR